MNPTLMRLKIWIVSTVAMLAGGVIFTAAPALGQSAVGSAVAVSGAVTLQRGGSTLALKPGSMIEDHDRISTGPRGRVTIALAEHGQVVIGESSIAVMDLKSSAAAPDRHTRITLVSGIVRTMAMASDPKKSFEVSTPNATVITKEGKADTSSYEIKRRRGFPSCEEFTDVAVLDGAAQIESGPAASYGYTTVPSGYVSTVACGAPPTRAGPLGIADARTLSETTPGTAGFLYTFFHDSSPTVEQEDIDGITNGIPDADESVMAMQTRLRHPAPVAMTIRPRMARMRAVVPR
jgi:hypothetical protein